ncbi:MAG: tRNA pseudouridine(55) synthase TruB [Crocinitomicaceae bacterium]|nr:tRNA pseudouridine(55) synthase TruB [Crocinitomicaceae bacterium]|tara:strand:+ start:3384 stop:4133 length:750 start_codon:yes stop_codon:yes gene_type:complete
MSNNLPFSSVDEVLEGQVLVFDKPLTWTSFDVVNKVRGTLKNVFKLRKIKVGHAGTLDPLATGVLILCTGKKTKTIDQLQAQEKTYTGTIRLGVTTPSFDSETEIDSWGDPSLIKALSNDDISKMTNNFIGDLAQIPPQFSAKKVDGVVAYNAARRGEKVNLKPKSVQVFSFEITSFTPNHLSNHPIIDAQFLIKCSKGTYIRALARDLGKALNVGGTLVELRRTKSGNFTVETAYDLQEFISSVKSLA